MIEQSKEKANRNSAYGLVDAAKFYYTEGILDSSIDFNDNGEKEVLPELKVSGDKPDAGSVIINEKGEISLKALYDNMCFVKDYDESKIVREQDASICGGEKGLIGTLIKDVIKDDMNNDMVKDVGDGFRYVGPNVNNYISFNDETWRIIGYIGDKVKIIKDESIDAPRMSSSEDDYWDESELQKYLNDEYYNYQIKGVYKTMIQEVDYKIGYIDDYNTDIEEIYENE